MVSYDRIGNLASPVDLWIRWNHARRKQDNYFCLSFQSSRQDIPEGLLSDALSRCLQVLHITPPDGAKYTSHSLRIGAHTEQVLLGIPLEVRLARFGWSPKSNDMPSTYFDRTIKLSPASYWVFGIPHRQDDRVPGPPVSTAHN